MFVIIRAILILLLFATTLLAEISDYKPIEINSHDININLDVPNHKAKFSDACSITLHDGINYFLINKDAQIYTFLVNLEMIDYKIIDPTDSLYSKILEQADIEPDENAKLVTFKKTPSDHDTLAISYTSVFNQDVSNVRFSNENVGREVTGTIIEQGAYLSPSAYYYPMGNESECSFILTANIPKNWESISDGNLINIFEEDTTRIQKWQNPYKMDGCMFMAAPYKTKMETIDHIDVHCYFFEEDTALFDEYLEATKQYIEMYNELIGRYPYARFTVAENFFPTGYGMPAWTLLGQQVIRLPFIKYTSLGHEVLHNWWGNSIYVDYERGNWCEGLTVYGADYRYKLLSSPEEARDYRKNILKQYVSYINEGNDFPIREFVSRTSPGTRTIGYNKVMMVFHYIEELIGTDPFFDAWKKVYADYKGKAVGWEEWIKAFEETSGKDLSFILSEWVDRAGAPEISVTLPQNINQDGLQINLSQMQDQLYNLNIPVSLYGNDEEQYDTIITLTEKEATFTFNPPFKAKSLAVDPEYHIFRKLYPEEVEPIVSGVLGSENKLVVCFDSENIGNESLISFAQNILNDTAATVNDKMILTELSESSSPIIINPSELPEFLNKRIQMTSDSITISGETFARDGHTFLLTTDSDSKFDKPMVVITSDFDSMPRIGSLVPHYGKYSYLVFEGAKNVSKGQWEIDESPLKINLAVQN